MPDPIMESAYMVEKQECSAQFEVDRIADCVRALEQLPPEAQARAMRFLWDKYVSNRPTRRVNEGT